MQRSILVNRARRPNRSVAQAVLTLTEAEQSGGQAILSLRETRALLTHLRVLTQLSNADADPASLEDQPR